MDKKNALMALGVQGFYPKKTIWGTEDSPFVLDDWVEYPPSPKADISLTDNSLLLDTPQGDGFYSVGNKQAFRDIHRVRTVTSCTEIRAGSNLRYLYLINLRKDINNLLQVYYQERVGVSGEPNQLSLLYIIDGVANRVDILDYTTGTGNHVGSRFELDAVVSKSGDVKCTVTHYKDDIFQRTDVFTGAINISDSYDFLKFQRNTNVVMDYVEIGQLTGGDKPESWYLEGAGDLPFVQGNWAESITGDGIVTWTGDTVSIDTGTSSSNVVDIQSDNYGYVYKSRTNLRATVNNSSSEFFPVYVRNSADDRYARLRYDHTNKTMALEVVSGSIPVPGIAKPWSEIVSGIEYRFECDMRIVGNRVITQINQYQGSTLIRPETFSVSLVDLFGDNMSLVMRAEGSTDVVFDDVYIEGENF